MTIFPVCHVCLVRLWNPEIDSYSEDVEERDVCWICNAPAKFELYMNTATELGKRSGIEDFKD